MNVFILILEENLSDDELQRGDRLINSLEDWQLSMFTKSSKNLINSILRREIKNYRFDVVIYGEFKVYGMRLMGHHLPWHNIECGVGNFTDKQLDLIEENILEIFPQSYSNRENVVKLAVLPTVVTWIIAGFLEWNLPQTRYYCRFGGFDRGAEALAHLSRKGL